MTSGASDGIFQRPRSNWSSLILAYRVTTNRVALLDDTFDIQGFYWTETLKGKAIFIFEWVFTLAKRAQKVWHEPKTICRIKKGKLPSVIVHVYSEEICIISLWSKYFWGQAGLPGHQGIPANHLATEIPLLVVLTQYSKYSSAMVGWRDAQVPKNARKLTVIRWRKANVCTIDM